MNARFWTMTMALMAATACGQANGIAVDVPQPGQSSSVLELLRQALPSAAEINASINEHYRSSSVAGIAAASFRPAGTTEHIYTVVELRPYLIVDNVVVELWEGTSTQDLADGTIVAVPYDYHYADATTELSGRMELRFVWDANQQLFVQSEPFQLFFETIEIEGVLISGHVYNKLLDAAIGGEYDNGLKPGVAVTLINHDDDQMWVDYTDTAGQFAFPEVAGGKNYTVMATYDGYYLDVVSFVAPTTGSLATLNLSLMPRQTMKVATGSIYGVLLDLDGLAPQVGAFVYLEDAVTAQPVTGIEAEATSIDGEFWIANVPVGDYTLVARAGASSVSAAVTVVDGSGGAVTRQDLTLPNHRPTALCQGPDGTTGTTVDVPLDGGETVRLAVLGDDVDGDALDHEWTLVGDGTLSSTVGHLQDYTADLFSSESTVSVRVYDGTDFSTACTFALHAPVEAM